MLAALKLVDAVIGRVLMISQNFIAGFVNNNNKKLTYRRLMYSESVCFFGYRKQFNFKRFVSWRAALEKGISLLGKVAGAHSSRRVRISEDLKLSSQDLRPRFGYAFHIVCFYERLIRTQTIVWLLWLKSFSVEYSVIARLIDVRDAVESYFHFSTIDSCNFQEVNF